MDDMFLQPKKPKPLQRQPLQAPPRVVTSPTSSPAPTQPVAQRPEPTFVPPEKVAAKEEKEEKRTGDIPKPPKKAPLWRRISKKKKIIIAVMLVLLLSGAGAAAYITNKPKSAPQPAPEVVTEEAPEPEKPTTEASKLTGIQIDPLLNKRGVTAVMIENSVEARPQSGLLEAGIVYEAIAEGGITRFMALYQEAQPTYIGPVRSARPYYIDWLLPYNASYAHAGGSSEALALIQKLKIRDMDHGANGSSFERVDSRFAPHNLYTSMAKLDAIRASKGWGEPDFTSFTRKEDSLGKTLTATAVNLAVSGPTYAVTYNYDAASNSYKRVLAGAPHTDEKSGTQLHPKVVVALVIPYSIHPDGVHSVYQTVGKGQAMVFQDGIVQQVSWSKASQASSLELKDAAGNMLALNAGQTWLTAVGAASMVTYTAPPAGATP